MGHIDDIMIILNIRKRNYDKKQKTIINKSSLHSSYFFWIKYFFK